MAWLLIKLDGSKPQQGSCHVHALLLSFALPICHNFWRFLISVLKMYIPVQVVSIHNVAEKSGK